MSAAGDWAAYLAAWAIPPEVLAGSPDSPWVLPRTVFARRADRYIADPSGPTHTAALAALQRPGSALDVGAGAGAASLPLAARLTGVTAVDANEGMLAAFAERAERLGVPAAVVSGAWPAVADRTGPADVVVCGHVLYNVPELVPFVRALAGHARRRVVVEITERHPLAALNPLWQRLHGITRPDRPVADDALAVLAELDIRPTVLRWSRPAESEYGSFEEMLEVTRRRLCLPVPRVGELRAALLELGVDPRHPVDLGSSDRQLVTMYWDPAG